MNTHQIIKHITSLLKKTSIIPKKPPFRYPTVDHPDTLTVELHPICSMQHAVRVEEDPVLFPREASYYFHPRVGGWKRYKRNDFQAKLNDLVNCRTCDSVLHTQDDQWRLLSALCFSIFALKWFRDGCLGRVLNFGVFAVGFRMKCARFLMFCNAVLVW